MRKRAPKEPRTAGAKWLQCDHLPDERWHALFMLSQKRTVSMFLWRLIQPGLATSAEVGASVARGPCEKPERDSFSTPNAHTPDPSTDDRLAVVRHPLLERGSGVILVRPFGMYLPWPHHGGHNRLEMNGYRC